MLSVTKIKSTAKTTQYFAKDDYYASNDPNHQKISNWYGNGAGELGLEGTVGAEKFKEILDGDKLPNGQKVGILKGMDFVHDPGRDLTFSAPKSVSIMALVFDDKRLIDAHNQAVKNTLDEIEKKYLKTRIKKDNNITLEATGKMVAAMFRHELSRDLDPQLHTHSIIANLTVDEKGKWRSVYFDEIYDNKNHLGLIYRSELAHLVKELGYEIEQKGRNCFFEIKNVPEVLLKHFSKRSEKIRSIAGENASQKALEKITLSSRDNKKVKEYEHNLAPVWKESADKIMESLQAEKQNLFVELIRKIEDFVRSLFHKELSFDITKKDLGDKAYQAVEFAINHLSERKTTFDKSEIISVAAHDSLSKTTAREIEKVVDAFIKEGLLLEGKTDQGGARYTTAELLAKENAIIKLMQEGAGKHTSILEDLSKYEPELSHLNEGQKKSANLILSSKDMVTGIQGFAGTGKTTMLGAINKVMNSEGYKIIGLSPTGAAARNLSSVGNINSMTLQRFLLKYDGVAAGRGTKQGRSEMQEDFKDKIVIVDESSMISNAQMKDLLTISKELNFRLFLVGDRRQLDSVESGTPFYEMLRNGLPFTDMREILRQENENLKSAVYSVIKKQIPAAFKHINHDIIEITDKDKETTEGIAVKTFMAMSDSERKETIILSPANEARDLINAAVSSLIYDERLSVSNKEKDHVVYQSKNLSEAEKTRAYMFKAGDKVLFLKNKTHMGIAKDSYCEVVKIDPKENLITIKTGAVSTVTFNPIKLKGKSNKNYFEVFGSVKRIFHEGDKVSYNRSFSASGIINSDNAIITKIDESYFYLKLADEGRDDRELKIKKESIESRHIDHCYAITAHKAQGLTCDNVIAICESWRKNLTTQKNFYVEISRARKKAILVTDNKKDTIETLEKNTGVQISAREHQGVEALGINMIGAVKKQKTKNLDLEKDNKSFARTPEEKNKATSTKYYAPVFDDHKIKEHFLEAIKSSITIEAKDATSAIDKAFNKPGTKIRFGQKKEYEICWYGEAGYAKSYKADEIVKWGINSIKLDGNIQLKELTEEEIKQKQKQAQKDREQAEKQKISEAMAVAKKAKRSFEFYSKSTFLNSSKNQYLTKKGINQKTFEGIRFTKDNRLVVPVQDTMGKIHSLQFIGQDGKKTFLSGGKKQGHFFMIDQDKVKDSKTIYLAEGFATAATINIATDKPVAVSFDAGNIEHVLKNLKTTHPDKEFIIAADNDIWKENNIGKEKAELAAQKYGAKVILPKFTLAHKNEMPTDFNDLHKLEGIHEVQRQIGSSHHITHEHHHDLQI